ISSVTNRRSQSIMFQYDALDRATSRTADGLTTTYGYGFAGLGVNGFTATANAESVDTLFVSSADRLIKSYSVRNGNWYQIAYLYKSTGQLDSVNATSNKWTGKKSQAFTYNTDGALQYFDTWAGRTTLNPG